MPTIAQIRAAIVAKLAAVPEIGVVHDYERWAKREADFAVLYVSGGQVRGWHVRKLSTRRQSPARGRYIVTHRWQIRGFMALDDAAATEKTFDDLVEAVELAFQADTDLGGVVGITIVDDEAGIQVVESIPVLFAGVLCHSARLILNTRHSE